MSLGGWDVVAALLGLMTAVALWWMQPAIGGYTFLWIGAPALAVAARRYFLPQLSPSPYEVRLKPTPGRRALGYALMIFGGLVAVFGAMVIWAGVSVKEATAIAGGVAAATVGGWIATLGYRRVG